MNAVDQRREIAAVQRRCRIFDSTGAQFLADLESAALATQLNTAYLGIVAEMRAEGEWEAKPADVVMSNAARRFFKLQAEGAKMTREDTLATHAPARIGQAAAQELINAVEAYTQAAERMILANDNDDLVAYHPEDIDEANLAYGEAQRRLEAAFAAVTGWTATFHPAEYRRDEGPVTAKPSDPPYWTIA